MALFRDFRDLTTAGETPATIAADAANIGILIDNVDTGNTNRESLFANLNEVVSILDNLGVGSPADASTTVKGIAEEADSTEINAGTDTGATGARLFVTPSQLKSQANERLYEFSKNYVTRIERQFKGDDEVQSIDFDLAAIDSVAIRTRVTSGTTYTTRADVTALNTYLVSLTTSDCIEVELTATFDAVYTGKADATVIFTKLQ